MTEAVWINLYGNHPVVFVTKQTSLIPLHKTQVYSNSVGSLDMYATCFGLYFGYTHACQYKNLTKEGPL